MSELPKISELLKQPEKMRVMCAEACGKKFNRFAFHYCVMGSRFDIFSETEIESENKRSQCPDYRPTPTIPFFDRWNIPEYDTSLDAMAGAEATLQGGFKDGDEWFVFVRYLHGQTNGRGESATAIQRLTAFLIAKGLAQP